MLEHCLLCCVVCYDPLVHRDHKCKCKIKHKFEVNGCVAVMRYNRIQCNTIHLTQTAVVIQMCKNMHGTHTHTQMCWCACRHSGRDNGAGAAGAALRILPRIHYNSLFVLPTSQPASPPPPTSFRHSVFHPPVTLC